MDDLNKIFEQYLGFTEMCNDPSNFFFLAMDSTKPKRPEFSTDLNNGYELLSISGKDDYCHLYKDGKQISKEIFRKGGMCGGFKDGFCQLINYKITKNKKKYGGNYTFGEHCIIDETGKIVFRQEGMLDHIYLQGGMIVASDGKYYNLLTGEKIAEGYSSVSSDDYIFVQNYIAGKQKVYEIEKKTGKVIIK